VETQQSIRKAEYHMTNFRCKANVTTCSKWQHSQASQNSENTLFYFQKQLSSMFSKKFFVEHSNSDKIPPNTNVNKNAKNTYFSAVYIIWVIVYNSAISHIEHLDVSPAPERRFTDRTFPRHMINELIRQGLEKIWIGDWSLTLRIIAEIMVKI